MAALSDQLRQLHSDLRRLADRDPEQEVSGLALLLVDDLIAEARDSLPDESTLRGQVRNVVSVDTIANEEPLRAADALIVVGQLLVAVEAHVRAETEKERAEAQLAVARIVGRRRAKIYNPDDYRSS